MPEIDNLLGSTRRVVEEQKPLNNCRGVTYRVLNVGGGGGGSVDYTKVVSKIGSMPVASADNADIIYLYDGETDANYTHGYIYENVATTTSSSASAAQTVGSGLSDITVDLETLESFTGWTTDNSLQIFYTADGWSVDTTSLGVTYTGTPNVGDAITITYTAAVTTYAWKRINTQPVPTASEIGAVAQLSTMPTASADNLDDIVQFIGTTDANYTNGYFYKCVSNGQNPATYSWTQVSVQPAPSGLPDQTGNTGKFLTTDGTDASWGSISALQNEATGTDSLAINDISTVYVSTTSGSKSVVISGTASSSSDSVFIGYNSGQYRGSAVNNAVICGSYSTVYGFGSVVVGSYSFSYGVNGVSIGYSSKSSDYGIAIGCANTQADTKCMQISFGSTTPRSNSDANTLKIANENGNYEMMDANGNIPADRIADTTGLTAGNYRPRLTIDAQGNKTITWVAE